MEPLFLAIRVFTAHHLPERSLQTIAILLIIIVVEILFLFGWGFVAGVLHYFFLLFLGVSALFVCCWSVFQFVFELVFYLFFTFSDLEEKLRGNHLLLFSIAVEFHLLGNYAFILGFHFWWALCDFPFLEIFDLIFEFFLLDGKAMLYGINFLIKESDESKEPVDIIGHSAEFFHVFFQVRHEADNRWTKIFFQKMRVK